MLVLQRDTLQQEVKNHRLSSSITLLGDTLTLKQGSSPRDLNWEYRQAAEQLMRLLYTSFHLLLIELTLGSFQTSLKRYSSYVRNQL